MFQKRWLDYGGNHEPLDYSVLAVGVMTLCLLLMVEAIRHRLDHAAQGRPFFQAVMEGVYKELATLGFVELIIFLVLHFSPHFHYGRKTVFQHVHFALFYTAIFNALQSVLVAVVTCNVSHELWVQTENLELDHYVEIREEFDLLQKQLERARSRWRFCAVKCLSFSRLRSRYSELLVQVRFHQLRLHFLEWNSLPLTLKVSDYLKRSEQRVLISLVHVSGAAWLMLTCVFNVLYYSMGLVAYKTGDPEIVGTSLETIFFSTLFIFIVICVAVLVKMRSIFREIISMKHLKGACDVEREKAIQDQRDLFWFSEPKFVIALVQFMQFGYAIGLAIVFMFWDDIATGTIKPSIFMTAIIFCYAIFVYVLAKVLPQYTLCTSLGHLVNQSDLQQTVACHRLEEEERRHRRVNADSVIRVVKDRAPSIAIISTCTDMTSSHRSDDGDVMARRNGKNGPRQMDIRLVDLVKSDTSTLRRQLSARSTGCIEAEEHRLKGCMPSTGQTWRRMSLIESTKSKLKPLLEPSGSANGAEFSYQYQCHNEKLRRRSLPEDFQKSYVGDYSGQEGNSEMNILKKKSLPTQKSIHSKGCRNTPVDSAVPLSNNSPTRFEGSLSDYFEMMSNGDRSSHYGGSVSSMSEVELSISKLRGKPSALHEAPTGWRQSDFSTRLRTWILSERYQNWSHLFGTSVVFFLIGMRIESMNAATGDFMDSDNTWDFPLDFCFWLEVFWYSIFILKSVLIMVMLSTTKAKTLREQALVISAILDFCLSSSCVALLFLAEAQRCCDEYPLGEARLLDNKAESSGHGYEMDIESGYGNFSATAIESTDNCCPFWGSRTFGGVGSIEPFTALIVLRVFRFAVSGYLARQMFSNCSTKKKAPGLEINKRLVNGAPSHCHHSSPSRKSEVDTLLQLWEQAIAKHPEIVKKYGHFSGELFRAMLGLQDFDEVPSDGFPHSHPPHGLVDDKETEKPASAVVFASPINLSGGHDSGLQADALDFTISAQLATKVLSMETDVKSHRSTVDPPPRSAVDPPGLGDEIDFHIEADPPCLADHSHVQTEIDPPAIGDESLVNAEGDEWQKCQPRLAIDDAIFSTFVAPGARLVRSLQRCDRKLFPLLIDWVTVDVAMTQFEIVYFEVSKEKEENDYSHWESLSKKQSSNLALRPTKCGRGLRLCDVAAGRKVVGRLDLSKIEFIHVERVLPQPELRKASDETGEVVSDALLSQKQAWQQRWTKDEEDRLKLTCMNTTLTLRFHADLKDNRSLTENEQEDPLKKCVAFQWAQTILYTCEVPKLRQHLPHFGEGDSMELRDFLEVVNNQKATSIGCLWTLPTDVPSTLRSGLAFGKRCGFRSNVIPEENVSEQFSKQRRSCGQQGKESDADGHGDDYIKASEAADLETLKTRREEV